MLELRSRAFGLALGLTASFALSAPPVDAASDDGRWLPRLQFGGKSGNERHLWEMQLDVPLWQDGRSLLFADVRGRMDDASSKEGNFGLAFRRMLGEDWIAGGYGFFDLLHSSTHEDYLQGTLGAELFSENWELRGNYYLPEAGARDVSGAAGSGAAIVGNTIMLTSGGLRERALAGFDVEVGRRLPLFGQEFWVHGGFFHFNASGFENVTGPRLRAEWAIGLDRVLPGSQLTLGAEWQDDGVRGSQGFAVARVEIPLGRVDSSPSAASWQERRMQKRIQRDVDIVTAAGSGAATTEPGLNPLTGKPYGHVYFAEAGAEGNGTQDDPTSLESALALAGQGGVVVALDGGGSFETFGFSLGSGMTLVGGGSGLEVMSASGEPAMLPIAGSPPTFLLTSYEPIAIKGNDVLLQGVRIDSMQSDFGAIQGGGISNVRIVDVGITMNSDFGFLRHGGGIHLWSVSDVEISNTTVTMESTEGDPFFRGGGIWLRDVQGAVTLRDNVVAGSQYESILIHSYNRTAPITIEATGNRTDGRFYVSEGCQIACSGTLTLQLQDNVAQSWDLYGSQNLLLKDLGGNTPTPVLNQHN